jgi:acyl-CoA synthetase (AMP-forming)/AMP-acid ligase II
MKGYLATRRNGALRAGGCHGRDLPDSEGYFFLTARKKEIIKVGGRRISPKEIEEVIVSIPGVVDCSISGVSDDYLGEALQAEIVLASGNGKEIDAAYIKRYCGERLAMEKVPGIIRFKDQLQIASTGKKVKATKAGTP